MSFENARQPVTKRTAPAYPGSSRNAPAYDPYTCDSPPRTPPAQKTRVRAYRKKTDLSVRPSCRETFLDDITPTDNRRPHDSEHDERDPHDLSLSPQHIARASIFDNMLLSLDQFCGTDSLSQDDPQAYSASQDPDPYLLYSRYSSMKLGRCRGHTFSSSLSSDIEAHSEDNSGRYSRQSTRGRRSNSGSNCYPTTRRIDSVRGGRSSIVTRGTGNDPQRATGPGERSQMASASRYVSKGSWGSGSSSLDFIQKAAGSRVEHSADRRSSSFDYGSDRPPGLSIPDDSDRFGSQTSPHEHAPHYDDIDAAPTPTVPVGPRRQHSSPPQHEHAAPQTYASNPRTPALSRKNSVKSTKSGYTKRGRSDTLGTATIRGRGDDLKHLADAMRNFPPSLPYPQVPAPSPTIAFHKSTDPRNAPESNTPPANKERPGFFRRVFGSSKNSSPAQSDREISYVREYGAPDRTRDHSAPSTARGYKYPPSEDPSPGNNPSSREDTPVVVKKQSSFFRLRKKSIAGQAPPPLVLAPHPPLDRLKVPTGAEPSPVSSLRKVMKPYLSSPTSPRFEEARSSPDAYFSMDDADNEISGCELASHQREFANCKGHSAGIANRAYRDNTLRQDHMKKPPLTRKSGPNLKIRLHERDDNFPADSSGNEGLSPRFSRRPRTSPNSPAHVNGRSFESFPGSVMDSHSSGNADGSVSRGSPAAADPAPSVLSESSNNLLDGLCPSPSSPSISGQPAGRDSTSNSTSKDDLPAVSKVSTDRKGRPKLSSPVELLCEAGKSVLPVGGESSSPRTSVSTISNYHTASNTPILPDADTVPRWGKPTELRLPKVPAHPAHNCGDDSILNSNDRSVSALDRQQAQRIFDEVEDEIEDCKPTAAWLGNPDRALVRKAYMELFGWSNLNILAAMRGLCSKMTLKGETQQVDRILDAFSSRWCECNPNHGFKATDVVHTISYSLLLLNTDLHLADIEQKMTRNQFIKNTMPTIQRVVSDAAPDAFETVQAGTWHGKPPSQAAGHGSTLTPSRPRGRGSLDVDVANTSFSKSLEKTVRSDSAGTVPNIQGAEMSGGEAGPLVTTPFCGTMRAWEGQIESVLKDFYNSIQKQRLPLRGSTGEVEEAQQASNNFLTITGNMLRRTPSTLSKSGSDVVPRGRTSENRHATARWSSKPRSRPRLYPASNMGSSRTSLDDQSSVWSPSASSTWSKYSLGKTLTSMSVDSLGSEYPRGDYQQSIGFANALSHAIIREDSANATSGMEDPDGAASTLEDESLELAGAPWAKEGSLKHKHHLDSVDKRAKDRNWNESFAVIQRGWMRLFSFNSNTKSMRIKPKQRQNGGLVVGGGNWMENAEETWKFLLRQTIASALPPPGYSKSRPHVWALSLPTGAVHLFQVGTPEIVKEFVTTANYWSARLSKEPLFGGISNIEYGWSDAVINTALVNADPPLPTSQQGAGRPSIQSSIRSSLDQGIRPRLPADRLHISDWNPPQQSMLASTLTEADQLQTLQNYVKNVEAELQRHNELRAPMVLAFSSRHPNSGKAMANWERKSSYLLREIVKFRTYIDCLQAAQIQKGKFYSLSGRGDSAGKSDERPSVAEGSEPSGQAVSA